MKFKIRFLVYIFSLVLLFSSVHGLGLSGKVTHHIQFEPGLIQEDHFYVSNGEKYVSSYKIHAVAWRGADFTEYFTITPEKIVDVPPGGGGEFTVRLELPDSFDIPGRHINWVKVDIDTSGGGFRAYPSVAVTYSLFVLYPTMFLQWSLNAPNMNVDEKTNFTIDIENMGKPTVQSTYADIVIFNKDTNQSIKAIRTNTATNIQSWDKVRLAAMFDSVNLNPGDYRAVATLNFDGNTETKEAPFRIGSKNVNILNFTKVFEIDAINKFDIIIESAWNNRIYDIYADIIVYDIETDEKVAEFKSINTDLMPWTEKTLQAYFDTSDLEKKEYKAIVGLRYEDATTTAEGIIRIDENLNVEIFEEIPGKETQFNLSTIFTSMNILILFLLIFIIINIILVVGYFKRQPPKPPEKPIDTAVIDHIIELKKKYNNDYIEEMMLKKGWSKEKVNKALKQASKKR